MSSEREAEVITVLMAEDDEDDRLLVRDAWQEARIRNELVFVQDGVDLLAYLRREGAYAPPARAPRPGLVLLDLNMPRMDGREALEAIKSDESLRSIPVVVMTNSKTEEDILRTYDLGASGFVVKPVSLTALTEVVRALRRYWFQIVELPRSDP